MQSITRDVLRDIEALDNVIAGTYGPEGVPAGMDVEISNQRGLAFFHMWIPVLRVPSLEDIQDHLLSFQVKLYTNWEPERVLEEIRPVEDWRPEDRFFYLRMQTQDRSGTLVIRNQAYIQLDLPELYRTLAEAIRPCVATRQYTLQRCVEENIFETLQQYVGQPNNQETRSCIGEALRRTFRAGVERRPTYPNRSDSFERSITRLERYIDRCIDSGTSASETLAGIASNTDPLVIGIFSLLPIDQVIMMAREESPNHDQQDIDLQVRHWRDLYLIYTENCANENQPAGSGHAVETPSLGGWPAYADNDL